MASRGARFPLTEPGTFFVGGPSCGRRTANLMGGEKNHAPQVGLAERNA